jgi:hypothetical protein
MIHPQHGSIVLPRPVASLRGEARRCALTRRRREWEEVNPRRVNGERRAVSRTRRKTQDGERDERDELAWVRDGGDRSEARALFREDPSNAAVVETANDDVDDNRGAQRLVRPRRVRRVHDLRRFAPSAKLALGPCRASLEPRRGDSSFRRMRFRAAPQRRISATTAANRGTPSACTARLHNPGKGAAYATAPSNGTRSHDIRTRFGAELPAPPAVVT